MQVSIQNILCRESEQVVLKCVEMTKDFEDIQEYALMKGDVLVGYIHDTAYQLALFNILYSEIYSLFQIRSCEPHAIESFRPALDSRFFAWMKNGEDVLVSRILVEDLVQMITVFIVNALNKCVYYH